MPFLTFSEYVVIKEGVLTTTRPPLRGMARINTLPITDGQRKRLEAKPVKAPNRIKPTVRAVTEIVPQHLVAKLPKHAFR